MLHTYTDSYKLTYSRSMVLESVILTTKWSELLRWSYCSNLL